MEEISYPLRNEIKIDFCLEKKRFYFSIPISLGAHRSVRNYVQARKERSFKPHVTRFQIDDESIVQLTQEVPFHSGNQQVAKDLLTQFWHLAQRCHHILSQIAVEEKRDAARS